MKIGIFGGTFNPPHIGHLILAERAVESLELDKIIFVPSFISPHKTSKNIVSAEHRFKMLKLCIKGKKHFEVSNLEIKRGGTSYTCDTLNHFSEVFPNSKLFLLVGYDNFVNFHLWKNYKNIFNLSTVVVLKRGIEAIKKTDKQKHENNNIIFLDTPLLDISSSEVRERIEKGKPVEYYVLKPVIEYIKNKKLYKSSSV
jgi:nicotinate-nucleotide adenylyltransferase